jgi:hypothetical protein
MGRFIKEFTDFEIADAFASTVNAEVITHYDWDSFMNRIIRTYRVVYAVS